MAGRRTLQKLADAGITFCVQAVELARAAVSPREQRK
jgi:hypothetical protein